MIKKTLKITIRQTCLRKIQQWPFAYNGPVFRKSNAAGIIAFLLLFPPFSIAKEESPSALVELGCMECHIMPTQALKDSSVKECPRLSVINQQGEHGLADAPDRLLINNLSDKNNSIGFEHRSHACMAEMGDKCATCHHYCPARDILPCEQCHGPESLSSGLVRKDVEEVCHHVCRECHREWNNETKCEICHKVSADENQARTGSGSDLPYPAVPTPTKKVYRTSYRKYPIVTFQHLEHIELLEFACCDCHEKEKCVCCHNPVKRNEYVRNHERTKDICGGCHNTGKEASGETCGNCHDSVEKPLIFHAIVGYRIPGYWKWLSCTSCHRKRWRGNAHRESWSLKRRESEKREVPVISPGTESPIIEGAAVRNANKSR